MTESPEVNDDFVDMIEALNHQEVRFVIVGAYALAAHGHPRATGDIDILIAPTLENSKRAYAALRRFGAAIAAHGVTEHDFSREGAVYQIGLPPKRIDLLTSIDGVTYQEAAGNVLSGAINGEPVDFIGRHALIKNKRAAGRAKDMADVETLEAESTDDT